MPAGRALFVAVFPPPLLHAYVNVPSPPDADALIPPSLAPLQSAGVALAVNVIGVGANIVVVPV